MSLLLLFFSLAYRIRVKGEMPVSADMCVCFISSSFLVFLSPCRLWFTSLASFIKMAILASPDSIELLLSSRDLKIGVNSVSRSKGKIRVRVRVAITVTVE